MISQDQVGKGQTLVWSTKFCGVIFCGNYFLKIFNLTCMIFICIGFGIKSCDCFTFTQS